MSVLSANTMGNDSAKQTQSCLLSVVVPVYRSEACLPALVDALVRALTPHIGEDRFEIVLVNDDSPDGSWSEIVRLAGHYRQVRGLSLTRNFGQHNATMAGLRESSGEFVVIMDDDLQHPPEAVPAILEALRGGADVCYTKYLHRKHVAWKRAGSLFNDWAARILLGKPRGLYLSSFKGMRRIVVDAIVAYDGPFTYIDGLILDVTRRIAIVPIEHGERFAGEGNYGFARSVGLWLKMATSFSVLPLRLAAVLGVALGIAASIFAAYIVISVWLYGTAYPGWASVITAVLLVGSIQLLGLGVMGEYLGRTYLRLNNKPQYFVRERSRAGSTSAQEVDDRDGGGAGPSKRDP